MTRARVWIIMATLVGGAACEAESFPTEASGTAIRPSLGLEHDNVLVTNLAPAPQMNRCSGIFISPHLVLTAAHCKEDEILMAATGPNLNEKVTSTHARVGPLVRHPLYSGDQGASGKDVALMAVANPIIVGAPFYALSEPGPWVGAAAVVFGYSVNSPMDPDFDAQIKQRFAPVTITRIDQDFVYYQHASGVCPTSPGDSGGPLIALAANNTPIIIGVHKGQVTASSECRATRADVVMRWVYDTALTLDPPPAARLTYGWSMLDGSDLDTRTWVSTPPRNVAVGWARNAADANYLTWYGDNRGSGVETVDINIAALLTDSQAGGPTADLLRFRLGAFWYGSRFAGNVTLKVASGRQGGDPTPVKKNVATRTQNGAHNGDPLGTLVYNLRTRWYEFTDETTAALSDTPVDLAVVTPK